MKTRTYRIIIEPDAGGTFHGYVPALPGCHTWAASLAEIKQKLREAMLLYVEDVIADHGSVPSDESFETFETIHLPDTGGLHYA